MKCFKIVNSFYYSFLVFLSLGFCVNNLVAQTYPFVNYTVESGLSQGQVLCAFQDKEGVMWFGTSGGGITKFDGNSYEYITDKDGLADNVVFCIEQNKRGEILIGTNNGLSVYNPNNPLLKGKKAFKNYTTKNGLSHNRIFCMLFDKDDILLGTGQGVTKFKDTLCSVLKLNDQLNNLPVFHLLRDSKQNLWCSTLGNGVFKVDGKDIKNYTVKDGLENDMVFSVLEKSKDVYWFFTGEGLNEFKNQTIKLATSDSVNTYYSYYKDKHNALWISSSIGVFKYNTDGSKLFFNENNGLGNNSIWRIFQDKESNMWFLSDLNGISKLANERFLMYTSKDSLLNDEIKRIHQCKNGDYLIGSLLGLTVFNDEKVIKKYRTSDFKNGNANVWAVVDYGENGYLIGTGNGLLLFDGKVFKRITSKDKASGINVVYDIHINNNDEILLGTQSGIAIVKDGFIQAFDKTTEIKCLVDEIYQDVNNVYWFGTDEGLYQYNGKIVKHFTEQDGFVNKRVNTITNDNYGNLWIATFAGIYKYQNGKFENISEQQGLFSNEVYSLAIDKNNIVWAGLTNGLDKISVIGKSYHIKHYSVEDGFLGQDCSLNAIVIDNKGRLVIGSSKGLMIYQAEYDKPNTLEPITKIKNIDLFYQKTDWTVYTDSVNNNIPYDLELPYDKNYLTFNFIGVSLTTPTKVSYQYMLKGIDKDWRYSSKTDVTYSNIPPGNYEFLLKATNGEGVWNKEPVVFRFVILPPFWKTWWFYSIIAIIIISGIYSYIKIRTSNKKILHQNEIIEEKNNALQYANSEIVEINKNITDSINYAKRIQQSFLTSDAIISKALKYYFILYKPRNIVSGDFYLAFDLPDRTVVICSDCTGHGIPGAFMSLISISFLNEIFRTNHNLEPAKILDELRKKIIEALNPEQLEDGAKDGMDISIVSIFKVSEEGKFKIHFAGANNALHLVSKINTDAPEMIEIRGDNQPVGYFSNMKPFTHHEILAAPGDVIYMYSDGYADQFGGIKGKKFMTKQLKNTLLSISSLPINEQATYLDNTYKSWQGNLEQVDDVTVIGIKL